MLFGSIQFGGKLGGYKIANHSATQLPQDLATGLDKLREKILGVIGVIYQKADVKPLD